MSPHSSGNNGRQIPIAEPLVEVRRGAITESRHRGHIAVISGDERFVSYAGAPETMTYLRSSAKPLQAIPVLTSGAADHFGFTDQEVALSCGSHSGEPIHTAIAAEMLRKAGIDSSALKCGIHEPFDLAVAQALRDKDEHPTVLHNNCSGKHAAMLAYAKYLGAPIDNYERPENPIQKEIARVVAQFSGIAVEDLSVGVDGCAVPVFGITVRAMALAYVRLVAPPVNFDRPLRDACERIVRAMTRYPELVGGTSERLDTEIMRAAPGAIVSKVGAEGVYTAGVLPCEDWPQGLGLALKVEDGDDRRARPTVVIESLRQLGVLRDQSLEHVARYAFFPINNRRGDVVGEIRASFSLRKPLTT